MTENWETTKINLGRAELRDFHILLDEGFAASWNRLEGERIQRITEMCRNGSISEQDANTFFKDMERSIKRKWDDHSSSSPTTTTTTKTSGFDPLEVSYKFDGVTDYGLALFCARIIGKGTAGISHMAAGDGVGDTVNYQDTLVSERVRHAFNERGYLNAINNDMRFTMTFDISLPTFTVREIGLFNNGDSNTGPLISRTSFDPGVEHVSGGNYVTINYLISLLSSS